MEINFEVKTIEIAGIKSALEALRLPFGKDARSECHFTYNQVNEAITYHSDCYVEPKDIQLMTTLMKRGDEHAKVLRGIIAYAIIDAPRYMWVELDTYKVGTDRLSSESTMHIQGKGMDTEELIRMKEELKEGTMQKRVQMFSYQTLRRIYYQRRNHRLPHWHKFCEWIKTLPYAEELILQTRKE